MKKEFENSEAYKVRKRLRRKYKGENQALIFGTITLSDKGLKMREDAMRSHIKWVLKEYEVEKADVFRELGEKNERLHFHFIGTTKWSKATTEREFYASNRGLRHQITRGKSGSVWVWLLDSEMGLCSANFLKDNTHLSSTLKYITKYVSKEASKAFLTFKTCYRTKKSQNACNEPLKALRTQKPDASDERFYYEKTLFEY